MSFLEAVVSPRLARCLGCWRSVKKRLGLLESESSLENMTFLFSWLELGNLYLINLPHHRLYGQLVHLAWARDREAKQGRWDISMLSETRDGEKGHFRQKGGHFRQKRGYFRQKGGYFRQKGGHFWKSQNGEGKKELPDRSRLTRTVRANRVPLYTVWSLPSACLSR